MSKIEEHLDEQTSKAITQIHSQPVRDQLQPRQEQVSMSEDHMYPGHMQFFNLHSYSNAGQIKMQFLHQKIHDQAYRQMMRVRKMASNASQEGTPLDSAAHVPIPIPNDWQREDVTPELENCLDIVLKEPGIYPTESINYLAQGKLGSFFSKLPQYSQINEEAITPYFKPGQDDQLIRLANQYKCKYLMSTSTVTAVLCHLYYLLSNFKSPHFTNLSEEYDSEPLKFMVSQRKPNTIFVTKIPGRTNLFSVDGDSGFLEPTNVVLLKMGKYMEKMLTTPWQQFNEQFLLDPETNLPPPGSVAATQDEDYFRYMRCGNLMLRSQIDCRGTDGQGNKVVFELKTRAACPIRYNMSNYLNYLDYHIVKYKGLAESFEREYYDLIRGGFLKYIMQCKIGRMDGAMIAYHNTQQIFGFEYIKLEEMEKRIFGCKEFSDSVFKNTLALMEKILDYVLSDLGLDSSHSELSPTNKVVRLGFYANEQRRQLDVMAEVFDNDDVYQERFRNLLPSYMTDPIDYYLASKVKPEVYQYSVMLFPLLNGILVDYSPILFESGDSLDVRYSISKVGIVGFQQYMNFLHEAYKSDTLNIENQYSGSWSFQI